MNKRKIAAIMAAAVILNFSAPSIQVLADEISSNLTLTEKVQATKATISKFELLNSSNIAAYDKVFKVDNSNIESITTNGGDYNSASTADKAIDGDFNTHWETRKQNSSDFTNEVVFKFKELTDLNRIVYAARQSSAKGKGFAKEVEIYGSITDEENDFRLISSGEYTGSTGDVVEIRFNKTTFKRIKFVFKEADQNWASASEFMFYKEDKLSDEIKNLFTDDTMSKVSEEFNTIEKLEVLEKEVKDHPFCEEFTEYIENAKILLQENKIEATTAITRRFEDYSNDEYSNLFKINTSNIKGIKNNGRHYSSQVITNAIDDNLDTYWETNTYNTNNFTNEVEVEFNEAVELNRIVYGARKSDNKGFAKEFEIYGSTTSAGETYQLVATGKHDKVSGLVEAKFNPTKFRRVKFKFKNSDQNWATLSEIAFYKEDEIADKVERLFTNELKNELSAEFNTKEKLQALEEETKTHPLYDRFKESLENAKELLSQQKIEPTKAITKKFDHYSNEEYSSLFKMDNSNIKGIKNNGRHYSSQVITNAIDDNLDTYWETNTYNTNNFTNEVEVEFNEAVELNRIVYGARKSDNKGFAKEFEIYGSTTSAGETYQLVATGKHDKVSGLVEAKFNPTKFRRVKFKFKNSDQNWATLSEIAFYKEDEIADKVESLFTNGLMNELSEDFNTEEKLQALKDAAKGHPLEDLFKESFELANKVLSGEIETVKIITAEQHGNMVKHAEQNLKFGFGNNNQPTGISAKPGDRITVYVDADPTQPLPKLAFSQQEGSYANWMKTVSLVPGKNVITVPEVPKDGAYAYDVTKGGAIYIVNPYTSEEQSKAPVIRFASGDKFPFATKDTNVEEFKEFLIEYKKAIDEDIAKNPNVLDREVLDVFEFVSDHIVWTGTATGAYKAYIEQGVNPLDTIESYNTHMKEIFRYYGLDGSSEKNDPKYIRENVRLAQPFGYMYAGAGHIGVQRDVMANHLVPFEERGPSWGLTHEIGHRMDVNIRLYGEVTNNMLPMHMSVFYNKIDNRIPYESHIYKNVIKENNNKYMEYGYFEKLAVFWQLEMYKPGYWANLNKLYRERNVSLGNENTNNVKMQYLIKFSSEVVGEDLSEYFARHGFEVNEETKKETSKYQKPDKKIWYLNNSKVNYEGNGFTQDTNLDVSLNRVENGIKLTFNVADEVKSDLLGYEIFRDGELIGFTSNNTFIDTNADITKNSKYEVIPYDLNLGTDDTVGVYSFTPSMSIKNDKLTLGLREEFNPMDYIKVLNHEGNDITSKVEATHNVDTSKKGVYQVKYKVIDEGIEVEKFVEVEVVSLYDYASDLREVSSKVGSGSLTKNKSIRGGIITFLRNGIEFTYSKGIGAHANSEVVYNIENKGYEYFESYIGVDQWAKNTAASVTFEVWVDGEKKFDSKVFKHDTDSGYVRVNVSGAKEVKLITTDAKISGNSYDHSIWADAKFITNNLKPELNIPKSISTKLGEEIDLNEEYSAIDAEDGEITEKVEVSGKVNFNKTGKYPITYKVIDSDGNEVVKTRTISVVDMNDYNYLTDYDWKSTQNSYAVPKKDISTSAKALRLTDKDGNVVSFERGIGAHATSTIIYDLTDKDYAYFSSYVGVDREMYNTVGSVSFQVYVDGEKKFDSELMASRDAMKYLEVDIAGAKELKLVVTDGGNGIGSDHATWGDAKLHFAKDVQGNYEDLESLVKEAKKFVKDDYTEESFKLFEETLNKAEDMLADKISTQEDINSMITELNEALSKLEERVDLNEVITIKDKTLEDIIKKELNLSSDNITIGDMYKLTKLSASSAWISSLEGLQYAKNLEELDISYNEIKDLSPLRNLKKLTNLNGNPQIITEGMLYAKNNIVSLDYKVLNRNGERLKPIEIIIRSNKTFEVVDLTLEELIDENGLISFDISNLDKAVYSVYLVYEDKEDNFLSQSLYMFNVE